MNRSSIIQCLSLLNNNNPSDCDGDLNVLLEINVSAIRKQHKDMNFRNESHEYNKHDQSNLWQYITLNAYLLKELTKSLEDTPPSDILSVQQNKTLQNAIRHFVYIGICSNLQPNMPCYRKLPTSYVEEGWTILNFYDALAFSTYNLIQCIKSTKVRSIILTEFKPILNALYQIIYCPIKKPNNKDVNGFIMTTEVYEKLLYDREKFKIEFDYLSKTLLKALYVRETMLLIGNNSPVWFKKAISANLDIVLLSDKGIETIAWAMLDSTIDSVKSDRGKNWNTLEVLVKLILNFSKKQEFETNICNQIIKLLEINNEWGIDLFCLCVKRLYLIDKGICEKIFLPVILGKFEGFSEQFSDNDVVTEHINKIVNMIYRCFYGKNLQTTDLPISNLTRIINIIIYLYTASVDSSHKTIHNELEEIIIKYLKSVENMDKLFDSFLFEILNENIMVISKNIYFEFASDIIIKKLDVNSNINISQKSSAIKKLCKKNEKLYVSLFLYYLKILSDPNKYFKSKTNKDLLNIEDEFTLDQTTQTKLIVYQNLADLADDAIIQEYINENPQSIIKYFETSLIKTLEINIHKSNDFESENFQALFTLVITLKALVMNSTKSNLIHYKTLYDIVERMYQETLYLELKETLKTILDIISNNNHKTKSEIIKTEVDKAIDDVCDPLLPIRGHGLLTLMKLIEAKHKDAMEKKNFILNIFQQNLKNDDSFIYLHAINGLVAMGDVFPDIVIKMLTDEYSDFTKKDSEDGNELRMKLGECLVRITRVLGETAPKYKYKSVLLNTFLVGTKDEDHLIRASSLSNLGEICRVLGYKLGSIVTEVLVCVHAIITTDKAVEARRAAVTVIRQLLAGLEADMIVFLKEHMLEVYRTLKNIYNNDPDDVMRLQAQLALEELDENVKKFVFPTPKLHCDKNVFMLS